MGPTWVLSAPDGPLVGLMNLAIRDTNCHDACMWLISMESFLETGIFQKAQCCIKMSWSVAKLWVFWPMMSPLDQYFHLGRHQGLIAQPPNAHHPWTVITDSTTSTCRPSSLTHRGQVAHICISKPDVIGSSNIGFITVRGLNEGHISPSSLVQIMARHLFHDKPLSELMLYHC